MDRLIYRGNSMRMVFCPGDYLLPEAVDFSVLKPGDVICFCSGNGRHVVHRIIRRTPEGLITMGDNNPRPDKEIVTPAMGPVRIVGADRNGRRIAVTRGLRGMVSFGWHRFRIRIRRAAGWGMKPILERFSVFFQKRKLDEVCFHGELCYFKEKRLIAKRSQTGQVQYVKWYYRGLYRIPAPQNSRSADTEKRR